jgi:hypothetical protein
LEAVRLGGKKWDFTAGLLRVPKPRKRWLTQQNEQQDCATKFTVGIRAVVALPGNGECQPVVARVIYLTTITFKSILCLLFAILRRVDAAQQRF